MVSLFVVFAYWVSVLSSSLSVHVIAGIYHGSGRQQAQRAAGPCWWKWSCRAAKTGAGWAGHTELPVAGSAAGPRTAHTARRLCQAATLHRSLSTNHMTLKRRSLALGGEINKEVNLIKAVFDYFTAITHYYTTLSQPIFVGVTRDWKHWATGVKVIKLLLSLTKFCYVGVRGILGGSTIIITVVVVPLVLQRLCQCITVLYTICNCSASLEAW